MMGNSLTQDKVFRWVNTIPGNVEPALEGSYHAMRRPYIGRYLGLLLFQFHHRFNVQRMMTKVVCLLVCAQSVSANTLFA